MYKKSFTKIIFIKLSLLFMHIKNIILFVLFQVLKNINKLRKKSFESEKVVLLFNNGQLGDLLVSSVYFENYDLYDKSYKFFFLIKEEYSTIFNEYNGPISIITYKHNEYRKSIFYKIKIVNKLNSLKIKYYFNVCADRGILTEELSYYISAETKYCLNKGTESLNKYLLNYFNKSYKKLLFDENENEYKKNISLIRLYLLLDKQNEKLVSINEHKIITCSISKKPNIVIAPFTSDMSRNWGVERYKELIINLSKEYFVVILGSENNKNMIKINYENYKIRNLIGKTTLQEATNYIANCMLFIGNDSGLTHLAFKLNKPIIALIGGGRWNRFFPYYCNANNKVYLCYEMECFNCGWSCNYKEMYCLTKISVGMVIVEAKKLISK